MVGVSVQSPLPFEAHLIRAQLPRTSNPFPFTLVQRISQILPGLIGVPLQPLNHVGMLGRKINRLSHVLLQVKQLQPYLRFSVPNRLASGASLTACQSPKLVGKMEFPTGVPDSLELAIRVVGIEDRVG